MATLLKLAELVNREIDEREKQIYQRIDLLQQRVHSLEETIDEQKRILKKLDLLSEETIQMLIQSILSVKVKETAKQTAETILEKIGIDRELTKIREEIRAIDVVIAQLKDIATDLKEEMINTKKFLDEALKRIKSLEQTSTKSFEEFKAVLADASAEVAEK